MSVKRLFDGVYSIDGKLATFNMVKGKRAYTEDLVSAEGKEYRLWNPYRSKLAAAILNGLRHFELKKGTSVLYLGAATGTTPSHISDIIGIDGSLCCVELSERNMRNLMRVCADRQNMLPILADAMHVEQYADTVGVCDVIYQDVSSRSQAELLLRNSRFLKTNGYAYFVIKSQSIDISKSPSEVFKKELKELEGTFSVVEQVQLEPYDELHLFVVLVKNK